MTKHTPGPWKVYHWNTSDVLGKNESPFILKTSREVDLLAECHANARMMEAAPELYQALMKVMRNINHPKGWDPIHPTCQAAVKDAEAAIAKAGGE